MPRWHPLAAAEDLSEPDGPVVRRPPNATSFSAPESINCLESYLSSHPRFLADFPSAWPAQHLQSFKDDRHLTLPARVLQPHLLFVAQKSAIDITHSVLRDGTKTTSFCAGLGSEVTQSDIDSLMLRRRKEERKPTADNGALEAQHQGQERHPILYITKGQFCIMLFKYIPQEYFRGRRLAYFGKLDALPKVPGKLQKGGTWAIVPAISADGDALVAFCGWDQGFVVRQRVEVSGGRSLYNLIGPCETDMPMDAKPD